MRDTIYLTTAQTKTLQIGSRALPLNAARLEKDSEPIPKPLQRLSKFHCQWAAYRQGGRARSELPEQNTSPKTFKISLSMGSIQARRKSTERVTRAEQRARTRHQIIRARVEKSKQQPSRIVTQKDHRKVEPGVQTLAGHDQPYNGANKNSSSWLASSSPERSSLREAQRTDPQASPSTFKISLSMGSI